MKKSLMATVAAVALLGGTSLALSEGMGPGAEQRGSPGAEQRGPAAGQSQQPSAQPRGATGQGSQQQPGAQRGDRSDRGAQRDPGQQPRGAQQRDRREQPSTTGQGTQERPSAQQPGAQPRTGQDGTRDRTRDRAQDRAQDRDRGAPGAGAQTETRDRGGSKSLTTEQKTKIRTTVINRGPKVSSVNFSINVGTVVPRSVRIVAVPPTLIEFYPEWRGYMYFVVGDEIIIVEPGTLRIVAVLDV
jgi:hypothetical protein